MWWLEIIFIKGKILTLESERVGVVGGILHVVP